MGGRVRKGSCLATPKLLENYAKTLLLVDIDARCLEIGGRMAHAAS
jgi:hypothetical protein